MNELLRGDVLRKAFAILAWRSANGFAEMMPKCFRGFKTAIKRNYADILRRGF